jgi:hypothetical protein
VDVDVKPRAGRRSMPDQIFALLMEHEARRLKNEALTDALWNESDFMLTQPNGRPIDPRSDLRCQSAGPPSRRRCLRSQLRRRRDLNPRTRKVSCFNIYATVSGAVRASADALVTPLCGRRRTAWNRDE